MSAILRQIYDDLIGNSEINVDEDTEMESLNSEPETRSISWPDLSPEEKKRCIFCYMKSNKIEGDISLYTFKDIRFNKEQIKITQLTYYRKGNTVQKTKKL
jgi:hypothetical protein